MDLLSIGSYRMYVYFKNTKLNNYKYSNLTYRLPKFKLPLSSSIFILSISLVNSYSFHNTNKFSIDISISDIYIQFLLPCIYEDLLFIN